MLTYIGGHFSFRLEWGWTGEHIDHTTDRIGAIQCRTRPLVDLNTSRLGNVDLIQGIVIEKSR